MRTGNAKTQKITSGSRRTRAGAPASARAAAEAVVVHPSRRCRPVSATNTSSSVALCVARSARLGSIALETARAAHGTVTCTPVVTRTEAPSSCRTSWTPGQRAKSSVGGAAIPASSANSTIWRRTERRDELLGRVQGDDLAPVDDRHAVAQRRGLLHVVGGQEDGSAARAKAVQHAPELSARLRVEAGRRLVEEEHIGTADERAGDGEPLLLPAGERAEPRVALRLELDERPAPRRSEAPSG